MVLPIGSMYAIYGNIYYQYTYGVPQKTLQITVSKTMVLWCSTKKPYRLP